MIASTRYRSAMTVPTRLSGSAPVDRSGEPSTAQKNSSSQYVELAVRADLRHASDSLRSARQLAHLLLGATTLRREHRRRRLVEKILVQRERLGGSFLSLASSARA